MGLARAVLTPIGGTLVFVLSLTGGALVHLGVPAMRRAVVSRVNAALASALPGKLTIDRIGSISPTHAAGIDAHAEDPEGVPVLRVEGADARISLAPLIRSLVHRDAVNIELVDVALDRADVNLDADASGALRLERTFVSKSPSSSSSRGVALAIGRAHVGHAAFHGRPPGAPPVDADLDDFDAAVRVAPGALAVDVGHARLTARRVLGEAGAAGDLEAHLARPSPKGGDLAAHLAFAGTACGVAGSVSASYDGGAIDAVVDVPRATPEQLRVACPSCSLSQPASVHAEAHGDLASFLLAADATVGPSEVRVSGPVSLAPAPHAAFHVDATHIDAHALAASAPTSDLSATADVQAQAQAQGAVSTTFAVQFAGGRVGKARVPPATLSGDASRGADAAVQAHVDATVREPGAPAHVTLLLAPKGASFAVAFDARVDAARLEDVSRLGGIARGRAAVAAHGTVDLGAGRLDAQLDATGDALASGALGMQSASLRARLSGPLAAPKLDAKLQAAGLEAPGVEFATATVEAHGSPRNMPVQIALTGAGTDVAASADVGLANGTSLRDLRVTVKRGDVRAVAQAALMRVAGDELRVDDAEISGFGTPLRASIRASPRELEVHAEGRRVNLARVARFARTSQPVRGHLSIDVDAVVRPSGASGHVVLDVSGGSFGEWGEADAHVDATLDRRRVFGRFEGHLGDVAHVEAQSSSIEVGGAGPLSRASWRRAWGALDVAGHVDLSKLAAHLPLDRVRLRTLTGAVDLTARIARDSADDTTPDVDVVAKTSGLAASGAAGSPWRLDGTEANVRVRVDGRTGFTTVDGQLSDARGVLLSLGGTSDAIPYAGLFLTDQPILDLVHAMPFAAQVTVPARDLGDLPPLLGTRAMHGEVAASASFRGSLTSPTLDARASLHRGRTDVRLLALPLDVDASTHYDGAHAEITLDVQAHGKDVLVAQGTLDARATDLLDGSRSGALPWTASLHAALSRFPLQSLSYLDDRQVRGLASGELALERLHDDAQMSVTLMADDLQVGDVPCRSGRVQASIAGGELAATARIDEETGFAQADARVGAQWGARIVPEIDTSHPVDVNVAAKEFRASLLLPIVSRVFAELDGRLDANARLHVDPAKKAIRPDGTIDLRDGLFELTSVGGEFHDANAHIVLTPDGLVRLENASARGLTGKVQAAATARLAGGAFAGARGVVQVPKQEQLPLVVDGVQVGLFDGQLGIAVDPSATGAGLDVNVDVPSAHLELPLAAAHDVETLGDMADVRIGIQRPGSDFVPVELDGDVSGSPASAAGGGVGIRVTVRLGKDVEVRRGTDLDVRLDGTMSVNAQPALRATGQIRLTRGTIDVEGKPFTIEDGLVTFVDDPANPQVKLRASWTASDGTTVYADFVGPLKTGKVTLSSDPVLSKTEILSLILFGTSDQSPTSSTSSSSQASSGLGGAAAGAAGGAATAPVNRALGGVNQMLDNLGLAGGISTKIDTSQSTPRPEVELQIARDISLEIAFVLGNPPIGSNPDTTLFMVNWRFLRQWSMQATVGDAGTSILDFVWKHRY